MKPSSITVSLLLLLASAALGPAGRAVGANDKGAPPPAVTARITEPAEGTELSGVVTLKVEIRNSDSRIRLGMVSFYAGDLKVAQACSGRPSANWDTSSVPNGSHNLKVEVSGYNRQSGKPVKVSFASQRVYVSVHNKAR